MTDPFRPDDDLVAAVLDGEATPEERARVEADPVLAARLAEFEAVRDLVATPVQPASSADREKAVAAAKVAIRHQADVVPFAAVRRQETTRFLTAAAIVLVVLFGVGFLATQMGDDAGGEDSAASGSEDDAGGAESAELTDQAGDAADQGAADDGSEDASSYAALNGVDLGAVRDAQALRAAIAERSAAFEPSSDPEANPDNAGTATTTATTDDTTSSAESPVVEGATGDSTECQAGLDAVDPGLSGLLVQATADYAGTPAVVYVFGTAAGGRRVIVVSMADCRTLAQFDL